MELLPSAHVDTFCRDHLPPAEQWPELSFDLPELEYPERLNCATALLDDVAASHGADRPCLRQPGLPTWSYAELVAAANRVARVLVEDLGIVPGNRVLLRGPNNQWLSAAWFGVLKAGAVLVTTMPLLRTGELQTIHQIARVDAALVDHRFIEAVEPLGVPTLAYGDDSWAERVAAKDPTFDDVATSSDDVCMLAFTSGTTGRPKATMHFHRDVMSICETFSRHVLQPSASDVFTGTPPYAFTFGLGGVLLFPLHAGASTLLVEKATPVELADLIDAHGVTICFTAPTAYKAMLAAGRTVSSLRRRCRRASTSPRRRGRRSARRRASRSSTASAPPRCSTSSYLPQEPTSGPARPGAPCPAMPRRSSAPTAPSCLRANRAGSRSRAPPGVATSTTPARRRTCTTAGT
jgi:2-aminobenzoate-CoA ligase